MRVSTAVLRSQKASTRTPGWARRPGMKDRARAPARPTRSSESAIMHAMATAQPSPEPSNRAAGTADAKSVTKRANTHAVGTHRAPSDSPSSVAAWCRSYRCSCLFLPPKLSRHVHAHVRRAHERFQKARMVETGVPDLEQLVGDGYNQGGADASNFCYRKERGS